MSPWVRVVALEPLETLLATQQENEDSYAHRHFSHRTRLQHKHTERQNVCAKLWNMSPAIAFMCLRVNVLTNLLTNRPLELLFDLRFCCIPSVFYVNPISFK